MVIKRRTRRARPAAKPARRTARRMPMYRAPRNTAPMLNVKKTFYLGNWQPSSATVNGFWRYYTFVLSDLPDLASYVAMFDTARINAIRVDFHPRFDNFAGNDTVDVAPPGITNQAGTRMSVVIDPKSNLVPSGTYTVGTYNGFLEQGRVRTYTGNRPFKVYFVPNVNYNLGAVAGQTRRRAPALQLSDANSQTVSHTGFHIFAWDQAFNGSFGNSFDLIVTFYLTFKGMR